MWFSVVSAVLKHRELILHEEFRNHKIQFVFLNTEQPQYDIVDFLQIL